MRFGELLRKHCEEAQLYLQRDLSLKTLAQACHTNRTYLGLYFASQGITYYIYINKLRIDHFQSLYREAMKEKSTTFTLQQLSKDSGFLSYNTFSRAFVSCTGISDFLTCFRLMHWHQRQQVAGTGKPGRLEMNR